MASWALQGVGQSVLRSIHHLWSTTQDQFASRIKSVDTSNSLLEVTSCPCEKEDIIEGMDGRRERDTLLPRQRLT